MAFFNKQAQEDRPYGSAVQGPKPQFVEPLLLTIEYIDGSRDEIKINYDRSELSKLFSTAMQSGSGLNFSDFDPPMIVNPRHIKRVAFKTL